jgi:hypothetical protein
MSDHRQLRVRFYPTQGNWLCVFSSSELTGMPAGADLVSATGATKNEAKDAALQATTDPDVIKTLNEH